jgi:hypothetical protein
MKVCEVIKLLEAEMAGTWSLQKAVTGSISILTNQIE